MVQPRYRLIGVNKENLVEAQDTLNELSSEGYEIQAAGADFFLLTIPLPDPNIERMESMRKHLQEAQAAQQQSNVGAAFDPNAR